MYKFGIDRFMLPLYGTKLLKNLLKDVGNYYLKLTNTINSILSLL
jgi:hypothetical protein